MGFDNDCILNISSLAGEYFCAICRTLVYPNEALQAPCTHLYCKPCLAYVVTTTHACPFDGYRVTEADSKSLLESNKALAETIGNIQVHCLYYRTGCTWQGSLSDCTLHCTSCAFGESPVLCNRCGIQIKHRQVQEHAPTCSGVQSQVQQTGGALDSTSTGPVAGAAPEQSQNAAQAGASASQAQISQAPTPVVSSQDMNQTANSATQPQSSQAAMPTPEQWYMQQQQYQQQYQQYYQQYPGYDPYQQNYQYYYQYPQAAQQHQQQHMQTYPPQAYGQAQPQPQPQVQVQPQPQVQVQPQPHQQSQVPSQSALAPLQPQAQPAANAQPHVQPQTQAQGQAPPTHAPPYNQTHPHVQPQNVPQQQMQVPQYLQTHSQMQHPTAQSYPQSQPQQYLHPQTQLNSQLHPQQDVQASVHLPSQQPVHPGAQQTPSAVSGYQSYPQPQLHSQAQAGAVHPVPSAGAQQSQYPIQMQGQIPSQIAQLRRPQPYSNVQNQHQPAMLSAHGQPPSGPAQQTPFYQHAQQPGYPFQQRPNMQVAQQAAQQQYAQQQSLPGQGPYLQPQPSMAHQLHAQGTFQMLQQSQQNYAPLHTAQPNVAQNYAGRPVTPPVGALPHLQTAGLAGTGQVRPPHQSQTYPTRTNNQVAATAAEQVVAESQRAENGEKPQDQILKKGVHNQNVANNKARDMARASGAGSRVDELKRRSEDGLAGSADNNYGKSDPLGFKPNVEATLAEKGAREGKPRTNGDAVEVVSEPSGKASQSGTENPKDTLNKVEVQDLKHRPNNASTDQGRNQLQHMPYASSAQVRPTGPSVQQSRALSVKPQQASLSSHPSNHVGPQGPGQAPAGPPFPTGDNPSGGILGSSVPYGRLGNVSHQQAGQLQNPHGSPFVGPSADLQRPGAFDSRAGMGGREPMHRPDFEQFAAQMPGLVDGRHPDPHPHGHVERTPYGRTAPGVQPGTMKFCGPLAQDSMLVPGMRDERTKLYPDGHFKHFPHREFEDDMPNFPRPAHLETGPSSCYGTQLPSSGPRDRGMFGGDALPLEKGPHGFDRDPAFKTDSSGGPSRFLPPFNPNDVGERGQHFPSDEMRRADFGRHPEFSGPSSGPGFGRRHIDGLPPKSPGRDYPAFPSRAFGPYRDIDRNELKVFDGSKPYNFPAESFGKSIHDNRFPVPPRGELDVPGNLRMGERFVGGPHNQDILPSHLRRGEHMGPRSLHLVEATAFEPPRGLTRMGEPPLGGNFPPRIPFGDTFGGEKHPFVGEPGFRTGFGSQHYAHHGGFFPGEMEPFDKPRMQKPGSIMCRICKVECGSVEGLDLHSQSREHQRKARDMVLGIKQQTKKQKVSKDHTSVGKGREGGRVKNSNYQGHANKR